MVKISPAALIAARSTLSPFRLLPFKSISKAPESFVSIKKMASWACSRCTYINPPTETLNCEICRFPPPQWVETSAAPPAWSESKWTCGACTFLNRYCRKTCEICGTRASFSLLSALEVDFDDPEEARLGSSVGNVFLPLQRCRNNNNIDDEKPDVASTDAESSGKSKGVFGGGNIDSSPLRNCSNKRKFRGDSTSIEALNDANKAVDDQAMDEASMSSKTWKVMSYNIWFREDVEMHNRMKALGNLIRLHSPDVICLQEVTPKFYDIFQKTNWWKDYQCTVADKKAIQGAYFCMQLIKLPVKMYGCRPFYNSIMGRGIHMAEVNVHRDVSIIVATSHLESPCPSPPTWDQMFSKERVEQANEAVKFLDKHQNVIWGGDMNWDDKSDGPFPLSEGWVDAWAELRPGEDGWTYDTKSNKMLTGNRTLQKRLDRFVCKLKDFKLVEVEMIGKDPIPGLSYLKEKKVKGQVKEFELPVFPSDHYGLLLTIAPA
ncbi:uncharacterized protein LOC127249443 [Andrographis paniculata]|uniref:uncharacterized protein LOC127249443 n=1 Tax=Andrographis paniculata TaxID=175694 RepID=UPI0021E8C200|nr:uncharacterized protein LOC127249443 [Andrographis paniculata]